MFRLVVLVLLILACGTGAAYLADYPAEIVLLLPHWRIAFSPVAAAAALAALLLLIGLLSAAVRLLLAPFGWRGAWRRHKQAEAHKVLTDGLLAAFAQDDLTLGANAAALRKNGLSAAEQKANSALPSAAEPLAVLLQAAEFQAERDRRRFFAQAAETRDAEKTESAAEEKFFTQLREHILPSEKTDGEMRLAVLKALHDKARADGDITQAGAYAAQAAALSPSLIWANRAAVRARIKAKDWEGALALYDKFTEAWRKAAKREKFSFRQADADCFRQKLLCGQAQALFTYHPHEGRQIALQAYKMNPHYPPAICLAAEILFQLYENRKAEKMLKAAWSAEPQIDVGRVYASGGGLIGNPRLCLARAQELAALAANAVNNAAFMLVAENALAAGDYQLAQTEAAKACARQADAQIYLLLAKIAQKQGDYAAAAEALAQALAAQKRESRNKSAAADFAGADFTETDFAENASAAEIALFVNLSGEGRAETPLLSQAEAQIFLQPIDSGAKISAPEKGDKESRKQSGGAAKAETAALDAPPLHGYAPSNASAAATAQGTAADYAVNPRPDSALRNPTRLNVDNPGIEPQNDGKTSPP